MNILLTQEEECTCYCNHFVSWDEVKFKRKGFFFYALVLHGKFKLSLNTVSIQSVLKVAQSDFQQPRET